MVGGSNLLGRRVRDSRNSRGEGPVERGRMMETECQSQENKDKNKVRWGQRMQGHKGHITSLYLLPRGFPKNKGLHRRGCLWKTLFLLHGVEANGEGLAWLWERVVFYGFL